MLSVDIDVRLVPFADIRFSPSNAHNLSPYSGMWMSRLDG